MNVERQVPHKRIVRYHFLSRFFGMTCIGIGVSYAYYGKVTAAWPWMILLFGVLVWPALAYFQARGRTDPRPVFEFQLCCDMLFCGHFVTMLSFGLLPTFAMFVCGTLSTLLVGGGKLVLFGQVLFTLGIVITGLLIGFRFEPETDLTIAFVWMISLFLYILLAARSAHILLTKLRDSREQLRESEERFRDFADASSDWYWEMDEALRYTYLSDRYEALSGQPVAELIGRTCRSLAETNDDSEQPSWQALCETLEAHRDFRDIAFTYIRPDGQQRTFCNSGKAVFDRYGRFSGYRGIGADITARKQAEKKLHVSQQQAMLAHNRLLDAIEGIHEAFALYDQHDRLTLYNSKYLEFCQPIRGYVTPGMPFQRFCELVWDHGLTSREGTDRQTWINQRMARHSQAQGVFKHRVPSGRWLRISERRTRDGGIVAILDDITEQYHLEQELIRQATIDGLTGAANRRHFFERANTEAARAWRERAPLSLLHLDVDHFKQINDCHGHAVGDHTLRKLVNGCRQILRETDILGRVGGEEFAVVLPKFDEVQSVDMAERLRAHIMSLEIATKQDVLRFTVSIGVAECRVKRESVEETLGRADQALYQAKHRGRNRVVAYTEIQGGFDH